MEQKLQTQSADDHETTLESRVFAELVFCIESCVEDEIYKFKLSWMHKLYEERLAILGLNKAINKCSLKNKLLAHLLKECQESDGRNALLVFNKGMQ